jgi:hypothetical protein
MAAPRPPFTSPIAYPPAPRSSSLYQDDDEHYPMRAPFTKSASSPAPCQPTKSPAACRPEGRFPDPPPPVGLALTCGPSPNGDHRPDHRETEDTIPTLLELAGPDGELRRLESSCHQPPPVVLTALSGREVFLPARTHPRWPRVLSPYLFDTAFTTDLRPYPPAPPVADEDPRYAGVASRLIADAGIRLVPRRGRRSGRLALELVRQSD